MDKKKSKYLSITPVTNPKKNQPTSLRHLKSKLLRGTFWVYPRGGISKQCQNICPLNTY